MSSARAPRACGNLIDTMPGEYVFGYGSLAGESDRVPARLHGWTRRWGVAMDNARDLPGYKFYTAPDGSRPGVRVCFLDVVPTGGAVLDGACLAVDAGRLAALDARERNYARVDVTGAVALADRSGRGGRERVWTYVGTAAARARRDEGVRAGRAVIARAYREAVLVALEGLALGSEAHGAALRSLDPGGLPVVELQRHELP